MMTKPPPLKAIGMQLKAMAAVAATKCGCSKMENLYGCWAIISQKTKLKEYADKAFSHKNVSHNDDIEGAEYGTYLMKGNKLKMKFEGDDSGEDIAYVSFQKNKSIMVWRYEGDDEGDCVYLQRYTEE